MAIGSPPPAENGPHSHDSMRARPISLSRISRDATTGFDPASVALEAQNRIASPSGPNDVKRTSRWTLSDPPVRQGTTRSTDAGWDGPTSASRLTPAGADCPFSTARASIRRRKCVSTATGGVAFPGVIQGIESANAQRARGVFTARIL